jgi:iron-sulfur cluster repair protein YtfE (RIC family)
VDGTKAIVEETVDALMASHPKTLAVFNSFGIDSCCGAHRSVRDAAVEDGVDEAALVSALRVAIEGAP